MMIIRIHGPFICSHWIIMYSFRAIPVKLDCNTTHPTWVSPHYCPWTNTQYDNTHINKAQMEKHLKKKKLLRAGPDLAQEKSDQR